MGSPAAAIKDPKLVIGVIIFPTYSTIITSSRDALESAVFYQGVVKGDNQIGVENYNDSDFTIMIDALQVMDQTLDNVLQSYNISQLISQMSKILGIDYAPIVYNAVTQNSVGSDTSILVVGYGAWFGKYVTEGETLKNSSALHAYMDQTVNAVAATIQTELSDPQNSLITTMALHVDSFQSTIGKVPSTEFLIAQTTAGKLQQQSAIVLADSTAYLSRTVASLFKRDYKMNPQLDNNVLEAEQLNDIKAVDVNEALTLLNKPMNANEHLQRDPTVTDPNIKSQTSKKGNQDEDEADSASKSTVKEVNADDLIKSMSSVKPQASTSKTLTANSKAKQVPDEGQGEDSLTISINNELNPSGSKSFIVKSDEIPKGGLKNKTVTFKGDDGNEVKHKVRDVQAYRDVTKLIASLQSKTRFPGLSEDDIKDMVLANAPGKLSLVLV